MAYIRLRSPNSVQFSTHETESIAYLFEIPIPKCKTTTFISIAFMFCATIFLFFGSAPVVIHKHFLAHCFCFFLLFSNGFAMLKVVLLKWSVLNWHKYFVSWIVNDKFIYGFISAIFFRFCLYLCLLYLHHFCFRTTIWTTFFAIVCDDHFGMESTQVIHLCFDFACDPNSVF